MICNACQAWIEPVFERAACTVRCPECGHVEPRRFLPLFIVTGPSRMGKTTVVSSLQMLLPDWEVFETDILWDRAGDWNMGKGNWLRIADQDVLRWPDDNAWIAFDPPNRLSLSI